MYFYLAFIVSVSISSKSFAMHNPPESTGNESTSLAVEGLTKKPQNKLPPSSSESSSSGSSSTDDSTIGAIDEEVIVAVEAKSLVDTEANTVPATASWSRMHAYLNQNVSSIEDDSVVAPVVNIGTVRPSSSIAFSAPTTFVSSSNDLHMQSEQEKLKIAKEKIYKAAPLRALERYAEGLDSLPALYSGQAMAYYQALKKDFDRYQSERHLENQKRIAAHQNNMEKAIASQQLFESSYFLEQEIAQLELAKKDWERKNGQVDARSMDLVRRLTFPAGVSDDEAALILYDITRCQLEIALIQDALSVANASLHINQNMVNKFASQQIEKIQHEFQSYDETTLQAALDRYEALFRGRTDLKLRLLCDIRAYQNILRQDYEKSKSFWYSVNILGESRESLDARIASTETNIRSAQINIALLENENKNITPAVLSYAQNLLKEKQNAKAALEANNVVMTTHIQEQYAMLEGAATDEALHKALSAANMDPQAVYTQNYLLNDNARSVLTKLEVNIDNDIALEYTGNHVQHYIQGKLIESLNAMGALTFTEQTKPLLNFAVACNIQGQILNKEHKVAHALYASQACDAIIEFATTAADYVVAAGEGVAEGLKSTAETLGHVGKTSLDTLTFSEVYVPIVREKFNKAALLVAKFFNAIDQDVGLLLKGDTDSLAKLKQRQIDRGIIVGNVVDELSAQWFAMSRRDRIKALSKFATEWECFGKLGSVLCEGLNLAKEVELAQQIETIVANPGLALAEEVLSITAETIDRDHELVSKVVEFLSEDTKYWDYLKNKQISNEIGPLFNEIESKAVRYINLKSTQIYDGGLQKYYESLMRDAGHGNKISLKTIDEALAGLAAEKSGYISGPLIRDITPAAEFIDKFGTAWDVKAGVSYANNGRYIFKPRPLLKSIKKDLAKGENIILDLKRLELDDVLKINEVIKEGLPQEDYKRIVVVLLTETFNKIVK